MTRSEPMQVGKLVKTASSLDRSLRAAYVAYQLTLTTHFNFTPHRFNTLATHCALTMLPAGRRLSTRVASGAHRSLATAATSTTTTSIKDRIAAAVTPEVIAEFQRDGAVRIQNLFTPSDLTVLTQGIDSNLSKPSWRSKVASRPDDPGWFFEDFCTWTENPHYREFIASSPAPSAAAALLKSSTVRLHHDHLLVKEPGTRQRTPWHQDQPYYNIEGMQNVSFWIPVDSVPLSNALEFVAGSHKGPWLMPRTFMDKEAKWFPEGSLADLPDIEADRSKFDIKRWELQPGDLVAFHMLTLHAAPGAENRRRAFSLRFIGDDIVHAPRRWATSPDFPGLTGELEDGAEMKHELFPVVWSEAGGQIDRLVVGQMAVVSEDNTLQKCIMIPSTTVYLV